MFNQATLDSIQTGAKLPGLPANVSAFITQSKIMDYVFGAAGIILLFILISAGFQMIGSRGDPKALQAAQGKITTAIIGLVIIFTAYWIVQIVKQFLGITVTGPI